MGQPKQVMRWGSTVIVRHIVHVLAAGGADEIVVVTGYAHAEVERALEGAAARPVYNARYAVDSMMRSIKVGLAALTAAAADAALIALGDQPQIQADVVRQVIQRWQETSAAIVVPSYDNRRGHPMLFARFLWPELLAAPNETTPRDFLRAHTQMIDYVELSTDSVLRDVDTLEDYRRESAEAE